MLWLFAQWVMGCIAVLAVGILIIRLLNPLPPLEPRQASRYFTNTAGTPLGRGVADIRAGHGDDSGVHMLIDGYDAFAARVLLARAATQSLDVQYYIWHKDLSGTLMLEALLDAAERGVRVRLLVDDNGIAGMDAALAALNRHPNIEVRLFNPFVIRSPKMVGYATDFFRLNRRMHNKSIIADNQAVVIGGRNVGDEYFSAADGGLFADLDVLAIGPVVDQVSADFDRYWASQSAYPAERILPEPAESDPGIIHRDASLVETSAAAREYVAAIKELPFIAQVLDGTLPFEWAPVRMLSDDPAKAVGKGREDRLLMNTLYEAVGEPRQEFRIISGYFVPTQAGVAALGQLADRGVDMAVFTNAFEAGDVWIVHAGYAHYRRELLKKGIRLFEMRASAVEGIGDQRRKLTSMGSGSGLRSDGGPVLRSSATTLHAKTFAVDRQKLFIGSFNFDPRSMHLNTEQGFVIESPALAGAVSDSFARIIPANTYEVVLADDGELNWIEQRGDQRIVHTEEPGTTAFQRGGIWLLSHLPIEWLL